MEIRPRLAVGILTVALLFGFGVFANPWLTTASRMADACLLLVTIGSLFVLLLEFTVAYRRSEGNISSAHPVPSRRLASGRAWILLLLVFLCWLCLYHVRWSDPRIYGDDEHYVEVARTWRQTWTSLLTPYNEHLVVPTRLLTFLLVHVAGGHLPQALACSAVPLFAGAYLQLFFLARNRFGSEFAGLLAVTLFSITGVYREIILWYSATQWLFATNLLLLNLNLAGKPGLPTFRRTLAQVAVSAAAPFSYSLGLLVGPLTSGWVAMDWLARSDRSRRWQVAAPCAGTLLAVVVAAPILVSWMNSSEYQRVGGHGLPGISAVVKGSVASSKLVVDQLLIYNLIGGSAEPSRWARPALLFVVTAAVVALLRARPRAWNLAACLLIIALSYSAAIPPRTWAQYHNLVHWTRYELLPQLGLSLLLTGGLCLLLPQACANDPSGRIRLRQCLAILTLAVLMTGLHWGVQYGAPINKKRLVFTVELVSAEPQTDSVASSARDAKQFSNPTHRPRHQAETEQGGNDDDAGQQQRPQRTEAIPAAA